MAEAQSPASNRPIVVVGSVNMDLVCKVQRMPTPGETIIGNDLVTIPGGKGANQAVGAAKLGASVHMVGRVGEDDFGERLINSLQQYRVNTDHVVVTEAVATGCAMILVDEKGENSIVVAPGANHRLTKSDIEAARELIASAAVVLMQLEIPLKTVALVLEICKQAKVPVILDPAPVPAKGLPRGLFEVDVLTPNQHEAEALLATRETGRLPRVRPADAKQLGADLLARGPGAVVLKLGQKGALLQQSDGLMETVRGHKAKVVDTTAAGDAFTAALAVALSEGKPLSQAVKFANAAGARCCEAFGAQPALPSREAVDELLRG